MAVPSKASSSVIVVRQKKTFALPPATLGFAHFATPDNYDPAKPTYKGNFHLNPVAIEALLKLIQANCIDANLAALHTEMERVMTKPDFTKFSSKPAVTPQDFLDTKLKEPKEEAILKTPYITLATKATYRDKKTGLDVKKTLACWDKANNLLDISKMKLGLGSVVEPIVNCNLYFSKVNAINPTPSLQLAGIRVLKLVQFKGSSNAPTRADEESIREVMGDDFEMDDGDLSQYAAVSASLPCSDPHPEEKDDSEPNF